MPHPFRHIRVLELIEETITDDWLSEFAAEGIRRFEDKLLVHAAFQAAYPEPEDA